MFTIGFVKIQTIQNIDSDFLNYYAWYANILARVKIYLEQVKPVIAMCGVGTFVKIITMKSYAKFETFYCHTFIGMLKFYKLLQNC